MKNIKISPIFYQGCKKKLIGKGLIDLFPSNIDVFYEIFGGSGVVSMNTKANKYVINDINKNLIELYNFFKNYNYKCIISEIEHYIKVFNLQETGRLYSFDSRTLNFDKELFMEHKKNYEKLRNYYNQEKYVSLLYILTIYYFSHQMRFNNKDEFNMPCGHDKFTQKNKEWIKQGCDFFQKDNVKIMNCYYDYFPSNMFNSNDFIYLDPPYLGTTATYNENGKWTVEDEQQMYHWLELLNRLNIRWGMSNSFANKGKINETLIDWCIKNSWNVIHFDVKYSSMGRGNSNNDEVYIFNYEIS